MNKCPILIMFPLITSVHGWEADGNGAKLRNLFLILRPPKLGSGAND